MYHLVQFIAFRDSQIDPWTSYLFCLSALLPLSFYPWVYPWPLRQSDIDTTYLPPSNISFFVLLIFQFRYRLGLPMHVVSFEGSYRLPQLAVDVLQICGPGP